MKTFALLFAFLPLMMAFMQNGHVDAGYILRSLLLLWSGVEICGAFIKAGSDASLEAVKTAFNREFHGAVNAGDADTAHQVLRSVELFRKRGAA